MTGDLFDKNNSDTDRGAAEDPVANILLGSSSFSEKDWVGPFYPEGTAPADFLRYYATQFRTVEVDATYYAVPSLSTVRGWEEKTPEGFLLAAKFPRQIVHAGEKAAPDPDKLLLPDPTYPVRDRFLEVMEAMGDKLGPLLIQFPYFNKRAFADEGPFFERLDRFLEDLPKAERFHYAVEIRNRRWLTAEFVNLLSKHGLPFVLVDHSWMPMGDELAEQFDPVAQGWGYVRLLGDRKAIEELTTSWDELVVDQGEKLERWAKLLLQLAERAESLFVYANNHYAGHSPATLRELRRLLEREKRRVRKS